MIAASRSSKRSTYGNDYLQAFKVAGLVHEDVAMQRCVVTHDQEEYTTVELTIHLNPFQLRQLAEIVAGNVKG